MFITKECDYAVRIVRALHDGEKKTVQEICEMEQIPKPYTYKILKKLENNKIVDIYRGAEGGYVLALPVSELTLLDVFKAVEGDSPITACLQDNFECPKNSNGNSCRVHTEFDAIQTMMIKSLERKTLAELFK